MSKIDPIDSKLINYMRFPMILGIVLIHLHFVIPNSFREIHDLSIYNGFVSLLYDGPTRIFVPLFFFVSGFLFYGRTFTLKNYFIKIRKRFYSLILPYLFYISLAITIFYIAQLLIPSFISEGKTAIANYEITDWMKAFGINGLPFVGPFWFIRNLFLIILISPIIYFYCKFLRIHGLILLGVVWITDASFWSFIPQSCDVFFFSVGAYYRINERCFAKDCQKLTWLSLLYIPIVIYCLLAECRQESVLFRSGIILGLVFFINVCMYYMNRVNISSDLTNASFMVYALHEPYLDQINKVTFKYLPVTNSDLLLNFEYIFALIILGIVVVSSILLIHRISHKYFPCITSVRLNFPEH